MHLLASARYLDMYKWRINGYIAIAWLIVVNGTIGLILIMSLRHLRMDLMNHFDKASVNSVQNKSLWS